MVQREIEATLAGQFAESKCHKSYIIIIKHMIIVDKRRMMSLVQAMMMVMMVRANPKTRIRKLRH